MTEQVPIEAAAPYREAAWFYADHRYRVSAAFVRALLECVKLRPVDRVLDLGSGPAMLAQQLLCLPARSLRSIRNRP
jgi:hypothetical protein